MEGVAEFCGQTNRIASIGMESDQFGGHLSGFVKLFLGFRLHHAGHVVVQKVTQQNRHGADRQSVQDHHA